MTRKHLYIIGARGFGREVYYLTKDCLSTDEYELMGYLDDKVDALDDYDGYPPIISSVEDYDVKEDDVFICALGAPLYKKKYAEIILSKGGHFISLVHPSALISGNTTIGTGCIILNDAHISCDVKIGDFVTLQPKVFIGHDAQIGDWSHLNTNVVCNGFVKIGEQCVLNTSAIIVPHKKVGNNSIVGAGSVVTRNVPENVTFFGNPAKKIWG